MNTFSLFIKNKLKDLGMSEREMAKKCNISHSYLNQLIKGANPSTNKPISPTIGMLKKLSVGLGMSVDNLQKIANGVPESQLFEQEKTMNTLNMLLEMEKDSSNKGVIIGSNNDRVIPWETWNDIKKAHDFFDTLGLDPSCYSKEDWSDLLDDIALVIKLHAAKQNK